MNARTASLALVLCLAPAVGHAQAVLHPNLVRVSTRFTNVNPEIRAHLDAPSSCRNSLQAISVVPADLSASSTATLGSRTGVDQELTVETSVAGISYDVGAKQAAGSERYRFATVRSAPVQSQPAAAVDLELAECVTLVRVCLRDAAGSAVIADWAELTAAPDPSDPFDPHGAQAGVTGRGIASLQLAARATGDVRNVRLAAVFGTDPASDRIRREWTFPVLLECDAVVELGCDTGFCDGAEQRGRIVGEIGVPGETLVPSIDGALTTVTALNGPWNNSRNDTLTSPAEGAFELENLPVDGCCSRYDVMGAWGCRSGRSHVRSYTRGVPVDVRAGETTDMGTALVMPPAWVHGDFELAGPVTLPFLPALHDTLRHWDDPAFDRNGDALPDNWGTCLPTSVTAGPNGAMPTITGIPGGVHPVSGTLEGAYELVLSQPGAAPSWTLDNWRAQHVTTATPAEPLSYLDSCVSATTSRFEALAAGTRLRRDLGACFGLVRVRFATTSGDLFEPKLLVTRHANPLRDYRGHVLTRTVTASAVGTPLAGSAAPEGLVQFPLPEGGYELSPTVKVTNPGGATSTVELLPVYVNVGCRQVLDAHPDLGVGIRGLEPCADEGEVRIEAAVSSSRPIARAWMIADGGAPVVACEPCGIAPEVSALLDLSAGEHEVSVHVLDDTGREAIATTVARFTREPSMRPGAPPLRVDRRDGRTLLSWEDVPGQPASLYRGTIASLHRGIYDHAGFGACGLADGRHELEPEAGSFYFVVGGACDWGDTVLARDSRGAPIPPATDRCP